MARGWRRLSAIQGGYDANERILKHVTITVI